MIPSYLSSLFNHLWQSTLVAIAGPMLTAAGTAAVVGPVAYGLANAAQNQAQTQTSSKNPPRFEVASIKPSDSSNPNMFIRLGRGGRYTTHGMTVKNLIANAYDLHDFQISGGPDWINSARYDIVAKSEDTLGKAFRGQLMPMLQSLLEDRFQFKFHTSTKELSVYALVVAKNGPKIQKAKDNGNMMMRPGQLTGRGMTMSNLAANLSGQVGRVVLDNTGLSGIYDVTLNWSPDRAGVGPGFEPGAKDIAPRPIPMDRQSSRQFTNSSASNLSRKKDPLRF